MELAMEWEDIALFGPLLEVFSGPHFWRGAKTPEPPKSSRCLQGYKPWAELSLKWANVLKKLQGAFGAIEKR